MMRRNSKNSDMIATAIGSGISFLLLFASSSSSLLSSSSNLVFAEAAAAAVHTEQIFGIQYSTTTSTSCSGSAVSFMGLLPGTTYDVKIFTETEDDDDDDDADNTTSTSTSSTSVTKSNNIDSTNNNMLLSCAEQSICIIDSESELCLDINPTGENITDGPMYVNDTTNDVYWIDESNGNEFTYTALPDSCIDSYWYPSCYYNQIPLSVLKKNPDEYLSNNNIVDLEQMIPFYYIAYYEDNTCTDLTGIISGISGEDINIRSMDDSFTCSDATICAINAESKACMDIIADPTTTTAAVSVTANFIVTDNGSTIEEYDPSNSNGGENINLKHTQSLSSCHQSSILSNCYYQLFSGITLAKSPNYLIGDFNSADSSNVNDDDDQCAMVKLNKHWISSSYETTYIYDDGEIENQSRDPSNITITGQNGCQFGGIRSFNHDGEVRSHPFAGTIKSTTDDNDDNIDAIDGDSILIEIGFPTGLFTLLFDDSYSLMRIIGTGRPTNYLSSNISAAFATDITYMAVDENGSRIINIDNDDVDVGPDCIDVSGTWYSDPFYFYDINYVEGSDEFAIGGPVTAVQNVTQIEGSCRVTVVSMWDNGVTTVGYYSVGVVVGSQVQLVATEGYDIKAFVSESVMTMDQVYRDDTIIRVAKQMLARDAAPDIPEQDCRGLDNMVGAWKKPSDSVTAEMTVDANVTITFEVSTDEQKTFDIINQSDTGCQFWGSYDGQYYVGIVHPGEKTITAINSPPSSTSDDPDNAATVGMHTTRIINNDSVRVSTYAGHAVDGSYGIISRGTIEKTTNKTPSGGDEEDDNDDENDPSVPPPMDDSAATVSVFVFLTTTNFIVAAIVIAASSLG